MQESQGSTISRKSVQGTVRPWMGTMVSTSTLLWVEPPRRYTPSANSLGLSEEAIAQADKDSAALREQHERILHSG